MATTATPIPNPPVTYALLVIFTVDPRTHAHLHDQQMIRDQAQNWLANLDATVHGVNVRKAGQPAPAGAFQRAPAVSGFHFGACTRAPNSISSPGIGRQLAHRRLCARRFRSFGRSLSSVR